MEGQAPAASFGAGFVNISRLKSKKVFALTKTPQLTAKKNLETGIKNSQRLILAPIHQAGVQPEEVDPHRADLKLNSGQPLLLSSVCRE